MSFYYLLLFIAPFHNDPRVGRVLFNMGVAIVTPAKLVGLLAVAGAFASAALENSAPRLRSIIAWIFVPFAVIPVVATLSEGLPTPTAMISQLLSAALLYVATRRLVRTRDRLFKVARVLVLAFAFSSLWVYKQHFIEHLQRPWGVEGENNYEALMLLVAIPMAFWMARHETTRLMRRAGVVCAVLLCVALMLTQSRAGILAGGVMLFLATMGSRHKIKGLLLLVGAALLLFNFGPAGLSRRFANIRFEGRPSNGDQESTRIHFELFKAGLHMMEAHPLLGIGLGEFKSNALDYNPEIAKVSNQSWVAHDTFVQLGAECGIPVLILFLAMIWVALRNFRSARLSPDSVLGELGEAMRLGLIGVSIAALSITVELLPFWIFIFLSQSVREISESEIRGPAVVEHPSKRIDRPRMEIAAALSMPAR